MNDQFMNNRYRNNYYPNNHYTNHENNRYRTGRRNWDNGRDYWDNNQGNDNGRNQNRNRSVEHDGGSREQRRDIPSENPPSNDQGTHIARVNYIMADERNHQEGHRGNCKPNPNSGNAEGRNRRNEEDIEPYVYDPTCDDAIERFTTAYNLRNPPENHIGRACLLYTSELGQLAIDIPLYNRFNHIIILEITVTVK